MTPKICLGFYPSKIVVVLPIVSGRPVTRKIVEHVDIRNAKKYHFKGYLE